MSVAMFMFLSDLDFLPVQIERRVFLENVQNTVRNVDQDRHQF